MKEAYLICNAHIDPIWQWDWQEGVSAVLSTFRTAADLAEKYDYIFCHNEVTVYKYVEEYAPDLFGRIRSLVKRGKWHIMGGWYLQPDCNMPSGESFVRQILVGKRYFKEKFGVEPKTAVNFDPFGHTRGLVQIISKCGQDSYIFCRPYKSEMELPEEQFVWKGYDGSTIKALRGVDGYNTPLGKAAAVIKDRIAKQKEEKACVLWGVGNHGGGPSEKDLIDIAELAQNSEYPIRHSTPEEFFSHISPVVTVDKSLHISMPGCYTTMSLIKQRHVELENELYLAEIISSVAALKGLAEYPQARLNVVVEDLLNSEFHDVLPGSSIREGELNGLKLTDHGLLEAERIKTRAFFALLKTQPVAVDGEYPIFVFNPEPYVLETEIECEFMLADQNWGEETSVVTVSDENGKVLASQVIKERSNIALDWRKRIVFLCSLKPLCLNRFSVRTEFKKREKAEVKTVLSAECGDIIARIDEKTGLLECTGKGGERFVKGAFLPVMFTDNADPWAMQAFQQSRLGTDGRPFSLSAEPSGIFRGMKSVQTIEEGVVITRNEAFFEYGETKARVEYTFYKNRPYVDVGVDVFFNCADGFVKLAIPVMPGGKPIGQTAFGTDELFEDARENVSQRFVALKYPDGRCLAVFNNCIYGSHYENDTLYLSLIRGASYCAHPILDRPIVPVDRFVRKIDQGERNFAFRIAVVRESELERLATEFNRKPYALNAFPIPYGQSETDFDFTVSDPCVTLVTMKKCEDGEGFVIRLMNNYSKEFVP